MKADVYYDDMGNDVRVEDIPEDMKEQAQEYHDKLIEAVAENDEELMMKYLDGEELTKEEIKAALRRETIANTVVPVACGSSYRNQRRSEAAGCHRRLHAGSHRHRGHQGHQPRDRRGGDPPFRRQGSLRCSGVQDRHRPVCRQAVLLPCLLRHDRGWHHRLQLREGFRTSASAVSCRCTPTTGRTSTSATPATSRRLSA